MVRRGISSKARGIPVKKDQTRVKTGLSFGHEADEAEVSTVASSSDLVHLGLTYDFVYPSSIQQSYTISSKSNPSADLASLYSSEQPSASNDAGPSDPTSGYSSAALAALKAATPSVRSRQDFQTAFDEDGNAIMVSEDGVVQDDDEDEDAGVNTKPSRNAFQHLDDPMAQGDSSLRFGAGHLDEGEGSVPSQSVIEAAKERRRRAAAGNAIGSEDFVSINDPSSSGEKQVSRYDPRDQGPHPESTLQREEDDLGSGEEEFADFTGATDRIALDNQGRKRAAARSRKEQADLVMGDDDRDDQEGDSDEEFERVQLSRMGMPGERRKKETREKSPYRPAPLPPIRPLPDLSSTSTRLAARLEEVEGSMQVNKEAMENAEASLKRLEIDEEEIKMEVLAARDREALTRELAQCLEGLAVLKEREQRQEEGVELPNFEKDYLSLLAQRTKLLQKAQSNKDLTEVLEWFSGVLPGLADDAVNGEETMQIDSIEGMQPGS